MIDIEQIRSLEKLIKRFKMKRIRTSIEVGFLLFIFIAACFLAEMVRKAASDVNFIEILPIFGTILIFGLGIIVFIFAMNFLFPKYIWDEKLRAFRNPKTDEILCNNCKGKIVLEKDKVGLFRICPKCGMMQEPLWEEQKKALRDIVSPVVPHKDRKKKAIRVSILNRSKKL